MAAAKKHNPHIPFDNTSFAALMRNADDTPNASDQDECPECGEHMLDCECEVVEEVTL